MRRRSIAVAAIVALGAGGFADSAAAQRPETAAPRNRTQLEADIRRGFARTVRLRVGLSDDQMQRLGPITQRHALARRRLQMEERETRMALQRSIRDTVAADSAGVERLLNRLVDIQKRRVQVTESEQRDLATIMTPIQRAKFMALQEQVRRQVEQRRVPRFDAEGQPPQRRGRPPPPPQR